MRTISLFLDLLAAWLVCILIALVISVYYILWGISYVLDFTLFWSVVAIGYLIYIFIR